MLPSTRFPSKFHFDNEGEVAEPKRRRSKFVILPKGSQKQNEKRAKIGPSVDDGLVIELQDSKVNNLNSKMKKRFNISQA